MSDVEQWEHDEQRAMETEITTLREQVEKLKALVVMRCDLDVPPQFSQGLQTHEVLEPVTAEHCQWFVAKIEKLTKERETRLDLAEQNKQLKAELKSIDGALNDPRANLTLTTSEIIWELKAQVEKLTKERDALKTVPMKYRRMQFNAELQEEVTQLQEQLAALAEQNEKFRETLSRWRYQNLSYNWCCGNCGAVDGDEHKEGCALSLPDLATPVLNRIRAEGMRMAADICSEKHSLSGAEEAIRARAAELEKTNG